MLKHIDAHHTLKHTDIALLKKLSGGEFRQVGAGEPLWREGDNAESLIFLQAGWACSARYHKDGSRQLLEIFLPGDVLGLCRVALSDRGTDAVMLTSGWISELPYSSLLELFSESSNTAVLFFAIANQRMAMLAERQAIMAHRSARERLAHFICECHTRLLETGETYREEFSLPLTQQDLADTLGMSAVHVSRTFSQLAREGLVCRNQFQLIILDSDRLKAVADFDDRYLRIVWDDEMALADADRNFREPPRTLQDMLDER